MKQSFFHQDFLRHVDLVLLNKYLLSKNLSEVTSPDKKANNSEQFRFLLSENPAMGRVRQLVRKLYQCYEVDENLPRPLYLFYTD